MRRRRWLHVIRSVTRSLKPQHAALLEACVIGLVSGFSAFLLKEGVKVLGTWRVHESDLGPPAIVLPLIGGLGGFIAGWLVERFALETSGSGIPQVKAVLARVPVKLDLRVALIKLLGGTIALGTGMPLGREGPTVQVGAALSATLSKWTLISPQHRRHLIAAGAGAGLAAAFNAPIAGFLFVLEELIQDLSTPTVGTAIVACFVASIVSRLLGVHSLDIHFNEIPQTGSFALVDIPFYLILGTVAGCAGAFFNKMLLGTMSLYSTVLRLPIKWRGALAGLITGLVVAHLPPAFRDNAGLREMIVTSQATWQVAAVAFVAQLFLVLIDYGSGVPGGLFAPSMALGAALGYLIGCFEYPAVAGGLPGTYALVGMGTFFSAICRVPMTAIVIVFEITHNFNIVLPLMVCCLLASLVADAIFKGSIYDLLLKASGITIKKDSPAAQALADITVGDVMQRTVVTLPSEMTLSEALEKFKISRHRGFPVTRAGLLLGVVTQVDLIGTADRNVSADARLSEIMTQDPVTVSPFDSLADVLHRLDAEQMGLMPVVAGAQLVGIITRTDIVRAIATMMSKQE